MDDSFVFSASNHLRLTKLRDEHRAYLLILCYAIILSIIDAAGFVAVVRVPEWLNNI